MDDNAREAVEFIEQLFYKEKSVGDKAEMSSLKERLISQGYRVVYSNQKEVTLYKSYFLTYLAGAGLMLLLSPFIWVGSLFLAGLVLMIGLMHGYKKTVHIRVE